MKTYTQFKIDEKFPGNGKIRISGPSKKSTKMLFQRNSGPEAIFAKLYQQILAWQNFVCLIVLTSDHQTFCSPFKVRMHYIGCINHYKVEGLCFDPLMR